MHSLGKNVILNAQCRFFLWNNTAANAFAWRFRAGRIPYACSTIFFCGAQENAITLTALTCEHGIRGAQSLADLRFAEELCARWNDQLFIFRRDDPSIAEQKKN